MTEKSPFGTPTSKDYYSGGRNEDVYGSTSLGNDASDSEEGLTLTLLNKDDEEIELEILKATRIEKKIKKIFIDENSAPYHVPKFLIHDDHRITELKSLEISSHEISS